MKARVKGGGEEQDVISYVWHGLRVTRLNLGRKCRIETGKDSK